VHGMAGGRLSFRRGHRAPAGSMRKVCARKFRSARWPGRGTRRAWKHP
jgi:hypothetical protein